MKAGEGDAVLVQVMPLGHPKMPGARAFQNAGRMASQTGANAGCHVLYIFLHIFYISVRIFHIF